VIEKPERNTPLKRPMTFWTNIKIDLKEIRWHDVVKCIHVAEEKDQKWVPFNNIINPFQYVHMQKMFNSHYNLLHILEITGIYRSQDTTQNPIKYCCLCTSETTFTS